MCCVCACLFVPRLRFISLHLFAVASYPSEEVDRFCLCVYVCVALFRSSFDVTSHFRCFHLNCDVRCVVCALSIAQISRCLLCVRDEVPLLVRVQSLFPKVFLLLLCMPLFVFSFFLFAFGLLFLIFSFVFFSRLVFFCRDVVLCRF